MLTKEAVKKWWERGIFSSEIIDSRVKRLCSEKGNISYCFPSIFNTKPAMWIQDGSFGIQISGYKHKQNLFQCGKPLKVYLLGIPSPMPRESLPIIQEWIDFREENLKAILLLGKNRLRLLEGVIVEDTLNRLLIGRDKTKAIRYCATRNKTELVKYFGTDKINDKYYVITLIVDLGNQNPPISFLQDINLVKKELNRTLCRKEKETDVGIIDLEAIGESLVWIDNSARVNQWWL